MYQTINSSQAVLTRLCVTVSKLQSSMNTLRDEIVAVKTSSSSVVPQPAHSLKGGDDAIQRRIDGIVHDIDVIKREIATLKVAQQPSQETQQLQSPACDTASPTTYTNTELEAIVRKECETHAKRQRDLLEALLTARYDRQINRTVQDAVESMRKEVQDIAANVALVRPPPSSPSPVDNNADFLNVLDSSRSHQDIKDIQIKEGHDGNPVVEISVKRASGGRGSRGGGNSKRGGKS